MESNLIVWSLNQLKIGLWEDMGLLFGKHRSPTPVKVYPDSRVLTFSFLYFSSISMAVLGNRYHSHEKTRKYKQQD